MNKLTFLLLALTGGLTYASADNVPAHIVQPLPKELNPQLEPPLTPPVDIVRSLTTEEAAQQKKALAPVSTARETEEGKQAIAAYQAKAKKNNAQIQEFRQQHGIQENTQTLATHPTEESFLQNGSPNELYSTDCDGDLYFDMEEGVLVFIKNVRIRNANLSIDCTEHLKIYADMASKPTEEAKATNRPKNTQASFTLPNNGNFNYDSIKMIAASGNVKASYTDKEGATSTAQADNVTYNAKTGEIILTGSPIIITPDVIVKNPNKDAFIRIYPNGNMYSSRGTKTTFRHVDKKVSIKKK